MQVWQLQESFCNDYLPAWTLLHIQKTYSVDKNNNNWFLWTMQAAQAAENHEDEWGLTW